MELNEYTPVNRPPDDPRELLRRLLRKADAVLTPAPTPPDPSLIPTLPASIAPTPSNAAPAGATPLPQTRTGEMSPVRPALPESEYAPPPSPISPRSVLGLATMELPAQINTIEGRLQAETALEQIRQKTAAVAAEFEAGHLNRVQFTALYAHYNEKRQIIERLLTRDPDSQAWQSVAAPSNTRFLRQHFEARVLSYAIYEQEIPPTTLPLSYQGSPLVEPGQVKRILHAVDMVKRTQRSLTAQHIEYTDGRHIAFVPGEFTTAIALLSLEPSGRQITLIQDLHRDFERANRTALARGDFQVDQMVFPHRALFEKPET